MTHPPSVDALARNLAGESPTTPHGLLVDIARDAITQWRDDQAQPVETIAAVLLQRLAVSRPTRVINATGVLLHTNLGRAPLHPSAADAAREVAVGYSNVELDLATGRRGGRHGYLSTLLTSVTGAEAGIAVNNNAGALLLTLAALAAPDPVAVSRGELIEIGGSFRLPALMSASSAVLMEVGTTNRTRLSDYSHVDVAAILKVHPSNYRVEGFSEEVGYTELAQLANERTIPFIADVGSGLLDTNTPWLPGAPPTWLSAEPGVRQTIAAGADIVLFSGDKLLGGPQSGLIVGRKDLVDVIGRHPMMRALRLDGPTLAALVSTLEMYAGGDAGDIPFWRMVSTSAESLRSRLEVLATALGAAGRIVEDASLPGAGSVPGETIETPVLEITHDVDDTWARMLAARTPIVARRRAGALFIDLRTVPPDDDPQIAAAVDGAPNRVR